MPDILDSLSKPAVGYAAGLVGGFGRDLVNFFMNRANNEANSRLALNQNRYNLEQWERETAYNSPAAQMARLREAGINPHLAYSQGQVMNEAASSPDMTSATYQPFQAQTSFDPATFAQINLLNAQAEQARSNAALADSQLPEAQQRILKMQQDMLESAQRIKNFESQISEIQARVKSLEADAKLKDASRLNIFFEQEYKREDMRQKIRSLNAQIRLWNSQADLNDRQVWELVQTFAARKAGFDLNNDEIRSRIGLNAKQVEYYGALIDKLNSEVSLNNNKLILQAPDVLKAQNRKAYMLNDPVYGSAVGVIDLVMQLVPLGSLFSFLKD